MEVLHVGGHGSGLQQPEERTQLLFTGVRLIAFGISEGCKRYHLGM
jgi:hypothetical protein